MKMKRNKASRFHEGDQVIVTHSVNGLLENMIGTVRNGNKDKDNKIEIFIDEKSLRFATKYLDFPKSDRFSSKFHVNDVTRVTRPYHRFLQDSISRVLSNYLSSGNQIIIRDERGVTGPIPEMFLVHV